MQEKKAQEGEVPAVAKQCDPPYGSVDVLKLPQELVFVEDVDLRFLKVASLIRIKMFVAKECFKKTQVKKNIE